MAHIIFLQVIVFIGQRNIYPMSVTILGSKLDLEDQSSKVRQSNLYDIPLIHEKCHSQFPHNHDS